MGLLPWLLLEQKQPRGRLRRKPNVGRQKQRWNVACALLLRHKKWEVSYFGNPLIPKDRLGIRSEPFALRNLSEADEAASPVMGVYHIAFGPKPIDDEGFDEFCNRWAELLAKAAKGQLRYPRSLPLR